MKKLVLVCVLVFASAAVAQPFHEGKYVTAPCPPLALADSTHDFDVRYYRVDLNLAMTSGAMTAHVSVDLTPKHGSFDTFSLHMVSLVCDSVRRAGNACTFTTPSGLLHITLDRQFANGESLTADIYYHRTSGTANRGFYWYARGSSGIPHALCYETTEPSDARYWLPCFDEPWDKADRGCAINVTVPDSFSACSNGLLDSVTTNLSAHTKTCWWSEHHPISTYVMTFAASRWATFKQWFPVSPSESLYMQHFIWPEDSSAAVNSFAHAVDMMTFFGDSLLYGRFPFEKYGMDAVYPYQVYAMEDQTMTMVAEDIVLSGDDNSIAHEMSHQWWGDMVTCVDWRNIWLNEGFATYSDELYYYHEFGLAAFLGLTQSRALDYFSEEASDPHPIYDPPYPDHLFDWGHTYCKGAWVQHMLRYVEGDTIWSQPGVFFRAMRAYGDSFKYGTAGTADYERIHERMTGLDLSWFFAEWVYDCQFPVYTLGWHGRQTKDGWEVVFNLAQNNNSGGPAVFHMPVEVSVVWSGGSQVFKYPVTTSPQENVFPVPAQPTSVAFDPSNWILDRHNVVVDVAEGPQAGLVLRLAVTGPNPATGAARLACEVPAASRARLEVYDGAGRLVRNLAGLTTGQQTVTWDRTDAFGRRVAAGAYFVRLTAGSDTRAARLLLAD